MRVLIVSQYFWPENFRINDLVEGLLDRGHEITVLTGLPNYPSGRFASGYGWSGPYRERYGQAEVFRVPVVPRGKGGGAILVINYLSFALSASLFGVWRCRGEYDAILVYEPSPMTVGIPARVVGRLKNAPIIFWVQDLWPESLSATGAVTSPLILKAMEHLVRWIYRGCARVLVQSEAFFKPVARLGVATDRILYFPNSAEAFYQPQPARTPWDGPELPEGFRVMFAGNIGAAQSLETILLAADRLRQHRRIHWIVVGEGRLTSWLASEVSHRGLQDCIHLMGRFPVESMPVWFAQADVMLATLRRDPIFSLTIPAKVQSYMACAKPIVAALDGEGARIVEAAGAGIAVPAEDSQALADAVMRLYRLPVSEREAMGRRGRDYFDRHFERNRLLDRLEGWLQELGAGRR
ncbi:MAG: glycosyltransferase family 4 protein [Gallionella sp.]|nr:glycosyltransferase family 4 protein [Gallionella sp.]